MNRLARWWRKLSLTSQADNHLYLAFGEMIAKVLKAGLNSLLGPMWPLSHSLTTSEPDLQCGGPLFFGQSLKTQ